MLQQTPAPKQWLLSKKGIFGFCYLRSLFGRERDRKRDLPSAYWFSLRMAATIWVGPSGSQELGILSVAGTPMSHFCFSWCFSSNSENMFIISAKVSVSSSRFVLLEFEYLIGRCLFDLWEIFVVVFYFLVVNISLGRSILTLKD